MRRQREMTESLPGDGWVRLAPGEFFEFHVDRPLNPSVGELQQWMRQIRGSVLSTSFGIENELILLALANMFGTNDHGSVKREYYEQEQAWRTEQGLEAKIDRIKPIIRSRRDKEIADTIIHKLAEYRELRNLLAHYPSWIDPVNDHEAKLTVGLRLFIADRIHQWEVDGPQATHWAEILSFVRISVENVRREIVGAPPLGPDGSPPPAESVIRNGNTSQAVMLTGRLQE
jgi:hypothetical protein